jgi:putative transposase
VPLPSLQKAYRYRALPTASQEVLFRQYAGARRWTYNWALARRKQHFARNGNRLSVSELCAELTTLKRQPEALWLREMNAQMLQQALRDLDTAFRAFFAGRARFPRFRSKRRDRPSFRFPQSLRLERDTLIVPKLGPVRLVLHRPLEGTLKSATIKQDATGAWYVTLVVHFEVADTPLPPPALERTVGLDLGLKDLAVLSDGERVPAPKHYRRAERTLKRLQRRLSRCQQGSNRREKLRRLVARQHQRVANQRKDHLHKLSCALVREHDAVLIEDLNVKGLSRTKASKSVYDAGWAMLRFQLSYKARWQRKHVVIIGRFFPSTRLCPSCGRINRNLTLAEREWTCACGAVHDRDLTAARNIRAEGLRLLLAVGTTESAKNAPRELVSPVTDGHGSTTGEAPPLAVG